MPTDIFDWKNGWIDGALGLEEGDGYGSGWMDHDCGYYPNRVNETRAYLDDPSHSVCLNANQKAYAAWWLWARLGGWKGPSTSTPAINPSIYPLLLLP